MLLLFPIKPLVWLALALQLLFLLRLYAWPLASFALHHRLYLELCAREQHAAGCRATCELSALVRQENPLKIPLCHL